MEPDATADLVSNNAILKKANTEVGVFVGDDDSSSICALRKAVQHEVVKQSDKNHTAKGVKNVLYKIDKTKDPEHELNTESIKYLHKCFTYAMAQHKGDPVGKSAAIKNIPFHAFNIHSNCGNWCGYTTNPENYKHKTVPQDFSNQILFEELKNMFNKLGDNADKFAAGASSQPNESLNAIMAWKCPKANCYSSRIS